MMVLTVEDDEITVDVNGQQLLLKTYSNKGDNFEGSEIATLITFNNNTFLNNVNKSTLPKLPPPIEKKQDIKRAAKPIHKPQDYGWVEENDKLIPVQSTNPPSPPHKTHNISCTKGCNNTLSL